jgi:hypothetical protein
VVYLAVIFGVMLWRGVSIEPEWVGLALLLIALALGRGKAFIFDWLPFLLLFFAYEVMRGFAAKTGFAPYDVSPLEKTLFGGTLPTVWLQQHFYDPHAIRFWDWIAIGFYFLHFPLPMVVGFVFWIRSRDHYWRFVAALLLMCFVAFVTYLFFPTTPPWLEYPPPLVHKVTNETVAKWGVAYYVSPIYSNLNPNRFAAFPSLHAAFPFLCLLYSWRRYLPMALLLVGYTACVWLAIVYLGEHYFVDALAGVIYAVVAATVVELVARRWPARVTLATPAS